MALAARGFARVARPFRGAIAGRGVVRCFSDQPNGTSPQQAQSAGASNPFMMFEQFAKKAQEDIQQVAQQAASKINEAASGAQSGQLPPLQDFQAMAESHAKQLGQHVVPIFTAMLILARTSPGQTLTPKQQEIIEQALPGAANDIWKDLVSTLPEDPQAVQLKRIADSLQTIEAKLQMIQTMQKKQEAAASSHSSSPSSESTPP